jgi:hypothetical protein
MANEYVDGTDQYGLTDLTIGSTAYVIESWQQDHPTTVIERLASDGTPLGQRLIDGFITASATVQVPAAGTIPALYALASYNDESWVVSNVSRAEEQQGIKKVNVQFRKVIN